jgi:hypothetical protein
MDKRGQALIEYVVLLVVFTSAAITGWQVLSPAVGKLYKNMVQQRADIKGMMP